MGWEYAVSALIAMALIVYLGFALLYPEKF